MSIRRAVLVWALATVSAFAGEIDGKWAGNIETPSGPIPMKFDLKSEGKKVTGTMVGPQGEVKIPDGAIEGNLISFTVTYHVYDTDVTFKYRGILSGDKIDFQMTFRLNEPTQFTVKRVQ